MSGEWSSSYPDVRGPLRRIVEVQEYRQASYPVIGGCIPLLLDCGHIAEANFTFSYKIGDDTRCFQCGPKGKQ